MSDKIEKENSNGREIAPIIQNAIGPRAIEKGVRRVQNRQKLTSKKIHRNHEYRTINKWEISKLRMNQTI